MVTSVPMLDLKAQYRAIRDEIRPAIDVSLRRPSTSSWVPRSRPSRNPWPPTPAPASPWASPPAPTPCLSPSWTLDIRPGDEVITSPFTFFATAGVIHRLHAKPVFVDIDPVTFNIDPAKIEAAVTPRTKAIMPVHLFGQMADMDPIMALARRLRIPVIEDGAQSIGAEYKSRRCGSIGDMGCFSFFPSKNLGAFGDAGMVLTSDEALYDKLKLLRVHGAPSTYFHKFVGGNFRLDAIQAAVLDVKLRHLDAWSDGRKKNAEYYDRAFAAAGLTGQGAVKTPAPVYRASGDRHYHIYNQYTIQARDREKLMAHLKAASIGCAVYYPLPLHLQECFSALNCPLGTFPAAEKAANAVLSLPVYPELTDEMKDYVVAKVVEFYAK